MANRCLLMALAWVCLAGPALGQDEVLFGPQLAPFGVAGMIGQGSPVASILTLQHGQNNGVWVLAPPTVERVSAAVEREMLKSVRDGTDRTGMPIIFVRDNSGKVVRVVRDRARIPVDQSARDYLLTHARRVKPEDLAQAADREVSYANLKEQPERYRGVPIHLEGTLRMVRRQDPPLSLRNDPEIKALYEAWISGAGDPYNKNPYCVLLTELPKGIQASDEVRKIPVTCDAYFFKLLQYEARKADSDDVAAWHEAPMLIGRTFQVVHVVEPADALSDSMRDYVLPIIVTSTFAVILVGGILLLFFRRGDLAVNARLRETRAAMFVDPSTTAPPLPSEPAPDETPPAQ